MQRAVAEIRRDTMARLAARIARDVDAGLLPPAIDAGALAGMVIALMQGMSVLARDGTDPGALLALAECALQAWPAPVDAP